MKEIIVSTNEAGQRLDKLLVKYLCEAPKSFIYKMLRKKNITLNGKKALGNEKLFVQDSVKLFLSDETIGKFSKSDFKKTTVSLHIIYEDEHVLLINKPVGMLSQKAEREDESLVEHIITYLINEKKIDQEQLKSFRPSVCNRLDRNTSGLVVAGKSFPALQQMGALFKERSLKKFYRCIVVGEISQTRHLKGFLKKDETTNQVIVSNSEIKNSLPIETSYVPIASNGEYTLLEVHLITGRTHQIRAHLSTMGHAIIGDYKYGNCKANELFRTKYGLTSQLLHAYRLEMPNCKDILEPLSNKVFIAPITALFQRIIKGERL